MTDMLEVAASPPTLRTRVLRRAAEVEEERERLQAVAWERIDADPDFLLAISAARAEVVRPHVVLVEDGERLVGAVVARLEQTRLELRFGYATLMRPRMRALIVVHGGLVGADDPAVARMLVATVDEALANGEADVAVLPSVRVGSAL